MGSKIRRAPTAASIAFVSHGVRFEIGSPERAVLDRAVAVLPVGSRRLDLCEVDVSYRFSATPGRAGYVLSVDGEPVAGPATLRELLDAFESHVTIRVAERAPQHVFVHAGVVAWRGHGVLLPGYSFAGKSTLVAELVRAGATYYSDEYAVLDREARVHPFPRPLQLRKPGERRQTSLPLEELGGAVGSGPLDVDVVLFCRYKYGAEWRPRTVTPGRAALEMFQYTMSAQYAPAMALTTLGRAVSRATLLKSSRGEAAQVIDFLTKSFDG